MKKKKQTEPSTKRLRRGYKVIQRLTDRSRGIAPTYEEIQRAMHYGSVASASRLVRDLIADGWATRSRKHRSIELLTKRAERSE